VSVPSGDPFAAILRVLAQAAEASSDFDLNPDYKAPVGRVLRPAAVLVPLIDARGGEVVLTKRSSRLKHHPGQIAFPGGKVEATDTSVEAAALREAQEEIGLNPAMVEVLGRLPSHETVTNFTMMPILGLIREEFVPIHQIGEVAEVFRVPLAHVTDLTRFQVERRRWRGEWRQYYTVPWGPYYIWGATARILYGLARRLAE
jgi:8-oxo-dGTP pyrophosphatase MutT (NUDIX family)